MTQSATGPAPGRSSSPAAGTLYVVATPIGHLDDLSTRAVAVLRGVRAILCEDTRHSSTLLSHYGIARPLLSLHQHNERARIEEALSLLREGADLALISDAGTPLVSDPGFHLVAAARAAGLGVSPIPGASALIAALSVAGLPSDRFAFEGFLPAKASERQRRLEGLSRDPRTLIFYEAPHRIGEVLDAAAASFGADRPAVLARELTKRFETILALPLGELASRVQADPDQQRGEIVLLVAGAPELEDAAKLVEAQRVYRVLAAELPPSQAARLTAAITGVPKRQVYGVE